MELSSRFPPNLRLSLASLLTQCACTRDARSGGTRAFIEASTLTFTRLLPRSRRFLAAFSDDRLAFEAKRGNEVAFEVIYDRHHGGLLSFCRRMLSSRQDAEDALQQTFASAFRSLAGTEQPIQLKPWLYTIARNRCISMLRGRHEHPVEEVESRSSTLGLSEEVEQRAELRELLADLEHLPERQKTALVLSEVGALDHAHIAQVLDCETKQVKSLVFQARSALIANRRAREIPCTEIREQLATASAGELRRGPLRRHLRQCQGCAEFRQEVRRQRGMLALVLPVAPTNGLKESALAAAGIGGGGAAGGGGLIAALGASGAAKVAAVGIAAGGAVGGLAADDPNLVSRAQAAVERAADGAGSVVPAPSPGGRDEAARAENVGGSLPRDEARRAAREKSRRDAEAGLGASSAGGLPPGAGGAKGGRGGQPAGRSAGKAEAHARRGDGPGSTRQARGGERRGSKGRGRDELADHGVSRSRRSRGGKNGIGRRLNLPGARKGGGSGLPRSLPGGADSPDRPLPKNPGGLPNRGRSGERGLGSRD